MEKQQTGSPSDIDKGEEMKNIILVLMFILIATTSYADFTVYSDKNTKEIYFIASEGEQVSLSVDDKVKLVETVMPGSLADYELTEDILDYNFQNGRFVVNTKKISDRENAKDEAEAQAAQDEADKITAKVKLIDLGFTDNEANVILR